MKLRVAFDDVVGFEELIFLQAKLRDNLLQLPIVVPGFGPLDQIEYVLVELADPVCSPELNDSHIIFRLELYQYESCDGANLEAPNHGSVLVSGKVLDYLKKFLERFYLDDQLPRLQSRQFFVPHLSFISDGVDVEILPQFN